jgi:hypothetical protein
LILVGSLDPQTPQGLGVWFQNGLGKNAKLVTVPYALHGTLDPSNPCVISIATQFFASQGAGFDSSCLKSIQSPDFDGSEEEAQQISLQAFGTTDLWNNGGLTDVSSNDSQSCQWTNENVKLLIYALVIPFGIVIIGFVAYNMQAASTSGSAARKGYLTVKLVENDESDNVTA